MFGIFPNSTFPSFAEKADKLVHSWKKLLGTNCNLFLPSHGREVKRELLQKNYDEKIKNI